MTDGVRLWAEFHFMSFVRNNSFMGWWSFMFTIFVRRIFVENRARARIRERVLTIFTNPCLCPHFYSQMPPLSLPSVSSSSYTLWMPSNLHELENFFVQKEKEHCTRAHTHILTIYLACWSIVAAKTIPSDLLIVHICIAHHFSCTLHTNSKRPLFIYVNLCVCRSISSKSILRGFFMCVPLYKKPECFAFVSKKNH